MSADEWIRKLWYIYTMEYYSAVKKNSFESVLMRWVKLVCVFFKSIIVETQLIEKVQDGLCQ